jgi:hypothetical protein
MNHRKRQTSAVNKTTVGGNNIVNERLKSKKSEIGKSYDKYSTRWTRKRSREREMIQQLLVNGDIVKVRKRPIGAENKISLASNNVINKRVKSNKMSLRSTKSSMHLTVRIDIVNRPSIWAFFISSVIGPRHPPVALHADTLILV